MLIFIQQSSRGQEQHFQHQQYLKQGNVTSSPKPLGLMRVINVWSRL
jgi:hypothetical protein